MIEEVKELGNDSSPPPCLGFINTFYRASAFIHSRSPSLLLQQFRLSGLYVYS